jgi:hypothetical protein
MKKILSILGLLIFSEFSFAQFHTPNALTITQSRGGEDYGGYNFQMYGEESTRLKESLLLTFSDFKEHRYIWKIKKIQIPGIDDPVTIRLHEGLHVKKETYQFQFLTFKNTKDKELKLLEMDEKENLGVLVYIQHGRKNALKTIEEAAIVKEYLLSLYEE